MPRLAAFFVFCLALVSLHGASPVLVVQNELLPSPASVGASTPQFTKDNNEILLWWLTPDQKGTYQPKGVVFDPKAQSWIELKANPPNSRQQHEVDYGKVVVRNAGRVAKAWFDSTPADPSIQFSLQPDPQAQFLLPLRIEDKRPISIPDLVLLADGTAMVIWWENYNEHEVALWLRRISPGGALSVPVLITTQPSDLGWHWPQLVILKDFDAAPAKLLLAYKVGYDTSSQIVTRLLTIAPATNEARHNPCSTCPDPEDSARGYALRGQVVSFSAEHNILTLLHGEISGILPAGKTEFKVDPTLLQSAATGKELFARIEKRGNDWWLFSPSWIVK